MSPERNSGTRGSRTHQTRKHTRQSASRHTMDKGSSVDPPILLPGGHDLSQQDQQTVYRLYEEHPQLRTHFHNVIDFLNLLDENPQAYRQLFPYLCKMVVHTEAHDSVTSARDDFFRFCIAVGFVEKGVDFYRKIMLEIGKTYITELPPLSNRNMSFDIKCLNILRSHFLNCTSNLPEFRLRLAQSGFLQDLAEDIKHITYMSAEALEKGNVFLTSLGTIHNCLRHPDVVPIVRQLDIAQDIVPFLGKRSDDLMVKSVALMTLAYMVEVSQLDLVRLDSEMLQFFLDNVQGALKARTPFHRMWVTAEVLSGLALLAKDDFNRKLFIARGAMGTLVSVLDSSSGRSEEEKQSVVTLITHLLADPVNRQVCKRTRLGANLGCLARDRQLREILTVLQACDNEQTATQVRSLLQQLDQTDSPKKEASTTLSDLLTDQLNMLTILDMGEVEYLMDQLSECTAEGGGSNGKVLHALTELTAEEPYRREIMARGALDLIKKVVKTDNPSEGTEALKVVLGLSSSEENRELIKNDTTLVALLRDFKDKTEDTDLAQLALKILHSLQL